MNSLVFQICCTGPAGPPVSIIGIGIGILLIIFTVGLANGTMRERAEREANVGAEIMFRASGSMSLSGADALRLPVSMASDIQKVDGVAAVVPVAQNSVVANDAMTGSRLVDGFHSINTLRWRACRSSKEEVCRRARRVDVRFGMARTAKGQDRR
jgi:hypothetical protein